MADSDNQQPEKKELSMEKRLLLAFVLMGAVLFLTPYFYKAVMPQQEVKKPAPAAAASTTTPDPAPNAAKQTASPAATPSADSPTSTEQVAASSEETVVYENDVYKIVFSNKGAVVHSWTLKKYKDNAGKPQELVNGAGTPKSGYPFALTFQNQKPAVDVNNVLYAVKRSGDGAIEFEYSNGSTLARKKFQFSKDSYLSQVSTEVKQNGTPVPHLIAWRGGFGDMAVPGAAAAQHSVHYDASSSKLILTEAKEAKDGPVTAGGAFSFAGVEDTYFAAVFLPAGGSVQIQTFQDKVPTAYEKTEEPFAGSAVGGEGRNNLGLFVGPKDLDILAKVNPKLEQIVDFGYFSFIAKPLFLVMHWVNDSYVHNYGWAIILMTIFINFAVFPLKISSMKSMKKMQALQPQITAINDKYKNISLKDPRKQEQNQEVMALYSKHGVNPLGGCMPMALQMPFLFAFYKVFTIAIEMRGASWLWVGDLSQHETIPIRILPIAMIVTQFIQQKMTPTTGGDPAQQKVMMFMPLMFGFMFYSASSGLVLYWLTGNLVNIAQQWFFNRTGTAADVAQSVQVKKKFGRK
ncbi:MAG: membrane protein insertase YidC [Bryobacteraceae bacterium]